MKSSKNYKTLILQLNELQIKGGLSAFDRTKLAIEIFNDREFRTDLGLNIDDFAAAKALDRYFQDLAFDFLTFKALYEYTNERQRWGGNLQALHAEMIESGREIEERPKRPKRSCTIAELQKVQDERRGFEAQTNHLKQELETAKQTIATQAKRIEELERDLANVKGKLEIYEKMRDKSAA